MNTGYPPIGDYALISDGCAAALVSGEGSIDWCCMPRLDRGSCFARLLDWDHGGHCSITATDPDVRCTRAYVDGTLVLETRLVGRRGEACIRDCFAARPGAAGPELLRVVDGVRGTLELDLRIVPRFDYGELPPWVRRHGRGVISAIGGDDALAITADTALAAGKHDVHARLKIAAGERVRLSIRWVAPERVDVHPPRPLDGKQLDRRLERTIGWWRQWASAANVDGPALRSAIVLKALANPRTGAIAAAATTSLPEAPGGSLNWDYRFSWIRDSTFSVGSLSDIGFREEADAFRRFVERSAAGSAAGVQIMYGLGGERRLPEVTIPWLEGYRGAGPVRVGNAASEQRQLDVYGHLLQLAWRWHERGHVPDEDYWRFLVDVVDGAAAAWPRADRGIWEIRGAPRHFVHSKAMCWVALDRGVRLAEACGRRAPLGRWRAERDALRQAIERHGYDARRGVFVQAFFEDALDSALLLLPETGLVEWDDPRMVRTVDAIRAELEVDGLLLRYQASGTLQGGATQREGAFLPCTFWLAECLARQGRRAEAQEVFDRACACGNDLGLFAEEFDPATGEMLGNFPQALTHLAHISAATALAAAPHARAAAAGRTAETGPAADDTPAAA